jgi:hypothetical protein
MLAAGHLSTSKPNQAFFRAAKALPEYARMGGEAKDEGRHRVATNSPLSVGADDLARLWRHTRGETDLVTEPEPATPGDEEWAAFATWCAHHNPVGQAFTERLVALLQEDEEDEEGRLRPTDFAFGRAWQLIMEVSRRLSAPLPTGQPAVDGEGGIPARSGGPEYLYRKDGQHHAVEAEVSPANLAGWLRWLTDDE